MSDKRDKDEKRLKDSKAGDNAPESSHDDKDSQMCCYTVSHCGCYVDPCCASTSCCCC